MKFAVALALLFSLTSVSLPDAADARPGRTQSSAERRKPKVKAGDISGVETIKPQEPPSKDRESGRGWNGAYVGVNAGAGFGTTAGTNVVVPIGTASQAGK